ncbi:DegT/DnrJ/EryC1/StrS aminotransferase family protein [Rhodococcus sp. SMB37]|nr:DegT/DnrJ/EryC1/StrS aminotransferase family protein [Rhodococcus sp. SMB37]
MVERARIQSDGIAVRPPKQLEDFHTAWLCYPVTISEDAGFERSDLQEFLEGAGIDTRTVWSGNVTRHPMMRNIEYRVPEAGLPAADEVFVRPFLAASSPKNWDRVSSLSGILA